MVINPGDRERELALRAVVSLNQFRPGDAADALAGLRSEECLNTANDLVVASYPSITVGHRNTAGLDPEVLCAEVIRLLEPGTIAQN